jgi:hypothetical protein
MRVAYVSGPYRDGSEWGIWQNVQKAREIAVRLWATGYAAICPHSNTMFFGGAYDVRDDVWIRGDLEILQRLLPQYDCIVMIPGWEKSEGAQHELKAATERGLKVYYWPDIPRTDE